MEPANMGKIASENDMSQVASKTAVNTPQLGNDGAGNPQSESDNKSETQIQCKSVKSCSSSSSSGSSSTGSDSTSSEDSSSSGSSESAESRRHHRHKAKHMNSRKVKRYSSSSDKEHIKRNNLRTGKGSSPSKKGLHSASAVNVGNLHREMKHAKKRRSRDRSDGHASPRKSGLGAPSGLKKSLSPPGRSTNANSHKRRSLSPPLKGGKQAAQPSKLGLNSRNSGGQHSARSPLSLKDKHSRSISPRSRDRERLREKEEKERESEREKERERDRDKRQREKEREPDKQREREKEREREKDRNRSRSPKLKSKDQISRSPRKEGKRKESPDHHAKSTRLSSGSQKGRDDNSSMAKHKVSPGDIWHRETRKDEREEDRKRGEERRHKDDTRKESRLLTGHHDDKDHIRERGDRDRDRERERMHEREREKEKPKSLMQQGIPSLLTLNLQHNPNDFSAHISSGMKDRGMERNRSLERTGLLRNLSIDRGRERSLDRMSERSRGSERDRRCRNNNGGLEKGLDHGGLEKELAKALARNREQDRTFERNERGQDRGLDRGLDRNADRGVDRSLERGLGLERSHERSHDRGLERGLDRVPERNIKNERGLDRGSPRVMDRDNERGLDRDPILSRIERGLERGLERTLDRVLERGSPRIDRDHRFSERSPGERLFGASHLDHTREPDDKEYDDAFEGRRERGRFSDQNRYDKGGPPTEDRRLGPLDNLAFNEERRRGREGRGGQWNDRKRDHNHEREHGRERDHGPRSFEGNQRNPGPNSSAGKRNDWEWDGRGRRSGKEWDGPHRAENISMDKEWGRFGPGQGDWSGPPGERERRSGGWTDEWRTQPNQVSPAAQSVLNRPPGRMLPMRDDSQVASLKTDDHGSEEGLKLKDQSGSGPDAKNDLKADDTGNENATNHSSNIKRVREASEADDVSGDSKKQLLEKDSALEEVLSDISDDADEILNREDSELSHTTQVDSASAIGKENHKSSLQTAMPPPSGHPSLATGGYLHHRRTVEGTEGVGNLGFEEISDGELEEEARARGISDALGVDWASLVAETRPRVKVEKAGSTRQHWEGVTLLTYIGVSVKYAGPKLVKWILNSAFNPQPKSFTAGKDSTADPGETSKNESNTSVKDSNASENLTIRQEIPTEESFSECLVKNGDNSGSESAICENEEKIDDIVKPEDSTLESVPGAEEGLRTENESMEVVSAKLDSASDSNPKSTPVFKDDVKPPLPSSDNVKAEREESKGVSDVHKKGSVTNRTGVTQQNQGNQFCEKLLHPVAGIHTALLERRARRQALFSGSGPYKRALSARSDLAIRRQLCNLSPRETTCDNGPAIEELYRLSLQLLERAS